MQMLSKPITDLDGMYVSDLLDMLEDIYLKDPKAKLSIEENEAWDSLSGDTCVYYTLVCYHKDERNQ